MEVAEINKRMYELSKQLPGEPNIIDIGEKIREIGEGFLKAFFEGFNKIDFTSFRDAYLKTISPEEIERFYSKERKRKRYERRYARGRKK